MSHAAPGPHRDDVDALVAGDVATIRTTEGVIRGTLSEGTLDALLIGERHVRYADGSVAPGVIEVLPTVTDPCLLPDVPDDLYHSGGVLTPGLQLSQSLLKLLMPPSTPAHFQHRLMTPEGTKRAFDVGRAAHTRALGAGQEMAPCPAEHLSVDGKMTTTKAKQWAAEQREAGVVPLTPADYDMVCRMADALVHHDRVADVLTEPGNQPEVAAFAPHPDGSGVWFRGRFDLLGGSLWDYKTSVCAEPGAFAKSAWSYGYHVQDVLYRTLLEVITGVAVGPMVFLVQEKTPPYLCSVVTLDTDFERCARQQISDALALFVRLHATHGDPTSPGVRWPGYRDDVALISPPRYADRAPEGVDYEPTF